MALEPTHISNEKRFIASLLIEKGLSKDIIRSIIKTATNEIRHIECYSNEIQEAIFKDRLADVVSLFIFNERRHRRYLIALNSYNYFVCRAQWINPDLGHQCALMPLKGDEIIDSIEIKWNDRIFQ